MKRTTTARAAAIHARVVGLVSACLPCAQYWSRRQLVIFTHLDDVATSPADYLARLGRLADGVHSRHLAGLPILARQTLLPSRSAAPAPCPAEGASA